MHKSKVVSRDVKCVFACFVKVINFRLPVGRFLSTGTKLRFIILSMPARHAHSKPVLVRRPSQYARYALNKAIGFGPLSILVRRLLSTSNKTIGFIPLNM